jgi:hypothetical protein
MCVQPEYAAAARRRARRRLDPAIINSRRVCLLAHANRRTNGSLQFKSTPMCIQTQHCEGPYIGRSTLYLVTVL